MVHYICDLDPFSDDISSRLKKVPKTPGTCLFIDIVNSTMVKYQSGIEDWGKKINNTFNFISILNEFPDNVVKGIGDEIMLFIPDKSLREKEGYTDYYGLFLQLYSTFYNLKNFPGNDIFMQCKASIHYCRDVYNISFLKSANDYYGSDIDLTARLMSKARPHRIVLSEIFYRKMRGNYTKKYMSSASDPFMEISSKYIEDFKGIPFPVEYRVADLL